MKIISRKNGLFACVLIGMLTLLVIQASHARADGGTGRAQIPTVSVATVTSTPMSASVTVKKNGEQDQINVRSGPGTKDYDSIGVLWVGQTVPAIGVSAGGDWIQIVYIGAPDGIGWVYEPLVDVSGKLPVVVPPPTSTPRTTPTIDPTLASQFLVEVTPTRLPTFTAAPPVIVPTFAPDSPSTVSGRVPMGFLIAGMAVVGLFGMFISFLRGR